MNPRCLISLLILSSLVSIPSFGDEKSAPSVLDKLKFVPGDEVGNEKKALKTELLVTESEQKAIAQLKKLIRKYKGTPLEPDLQFRLAELYMRRSKTDRFFEIHRQSETVVKLAPRLVSNASSRRTLTQAVDVYQYIQKRFPGYSQMDLVIFNHAFARQALGQDKEAENLYWTLIKQFPDSMLVPDAHLAIGEIAFQKAQFKTALEHFDAIRKYPESRVYPYGLYKAAWTRYNMRDTAGGLKNLEEVVAFGNKVAKEHLDAKLDLRKEALSDMTIFYEDVYPAKKAYSYFRDQAGATDLPPTLMKLASLYDRHARYQDEREVLTQVVDRIPASDVVPDAWNKRILADDSLKQKKSAVDDMESFAQVCGSRSDYMKAHPQGGKSCLDTLQKTSVILAQKWLKIWNKNPYDESYADSSEKAFQIFLRFKRADQEYTKAHFLYAELLFKRKKYRQASEEYASVGSAAGEKISHDADYAACVSLENAVGDKWSEKDEKSFHQLAETYVKNHPKGAYRLEVEFKMALLAYERNRYDEAAPLFLQLGNQFPKEEKGQKAQDLYLDILNIKKDYGGIRAYAKELMKKPATADRDAKLAKIYEQAYFMEVQKREEKGDLQGALHGYQQFTKDNPHSDLAEKAYWNLAQLHFKTGDAYGGAQASLDFAKRFPKSDQAKQALIKAAKTFEEMAQLDKAADVLVQLAEKDPGSKAKWNENAADFYALSGHAQQARKLYQGLMTSVSESEYKRLLLKLEVFEKSYGTDSSHAAVTKQIVQKDIEPIANQVRIAKLQAMFDDHNYTDAFDKAKKYLGMSSFTPAEKAKVRMIQAQILEDEFVKQSVKAKPERLAMVLGIKTEKLGKVEQAYQSVIRYGDASTAVQAMEHLYHCFDHYVTALKSIPAPAGFSAADAQAFQRELQNLILPLEDKSADTLAQALSFAKKHQIVDGTIDRLESELAKVNHQPQLAEHFAITEPGMALPVEGRTL